MNTLFNRLVLVAAFTGCLSLAACDEAENDPLATPAGADGAHNANRPGDAGHGADGARAGDAARTGNHGVDGHPGGVTGAAGGHPGGMGVDGKEPDNTAHNKGDGEGDATKTPFDQSNAQEDIKVTADIRKAILGMEGMSTNADNVKVITSADGVAIRGVVESQSEIDAITKLVQQHAGTRKTDIQLSVDPD
jgi:hypothetical protein